MGTYDFVEGLKCPQCGVLLDEAQTKDGSRNFAVLHPSSVFIEHKYDDDHPERMIAYGECSICHIDWDVSMPLIRVTGKCVISCDESTYKYKRRL